MWLYCVGTEKTKEEEEDTDSDITSSSDSLDIKSASSSNGDAAESSRVVNQCSTPRSRGVRRRVGTLTKSMSISDTLDQHVLASTMAMREHSPSISGTSPFAVGPPGRSDRDNSSGRQLQHALSTMVNSQQYHDVVFLVGTPTITMYGHKVILAARCPALAKMFAGGQVELAFPHVSKDTFLELLHYLYAGDLNMRDVDTCQSLSDLANQLELVELAMICIEHLSDQMMAPSDRKSDRPLSRLRFLEEKLGSVAATIDTMKKQAQGSPP